IGGPEENRRWLTPEATGDVSKGTLEAHFRNRFEALLERARGEAEGWLRRRAEALRAHRQKQAEILRQDLERDLADRLEEIDEEERRARGLIDATGHLRLFAEQEVSGFQARREALESYRNQRLEEIAAFEQVHEPPPPQPLGALFLVPEGGAV
ncbi:MAG: hypothetical protein C4307_04735, partial [Chloroflexota bacterium]